MKSEWNVEKSRKLYGVPEWSHGYFDINKNGNIEVTPFGKKGHRVDIYSIVKDLIQRQVRFPVLIRFSDIIRSQVRSINFCFQKAIKEYGYKGAYYGVYPIKVNQQSHVVRDIVRSGQNYHFGLEVGSKPELLIALSQISDKKSLIVCNGFKDASYIEMALMFKKLGHNVFIVVERIKELYIILDIARKLKINPQIGFRIKLYTQSTGKWQASSGSKSKFGLTSSEINKGVEYLNEEGFKQSLKLIHFHIGSQVNSIQPIKSAIKEASRVMVELHKQGCHIQYMDVGGGLGVDYDGSRTSDSSTNYTSQEYANDIVFHIQSICDENEIAHPHIITESGRFLVAHSSLLIFNILDSHVVENENKNFNIELKKEDHTFVHDLHDIYKNLHRIPINESFNDLVEKKKDIHQLFTYGVLSLDQVAKSEQIYQMICSKLKEMASNKEDGEDILESLITELTDTYFCNFSIFQSLPDSWALKHIFPVMPIHRLKEEPYRHAVLVDLTCDSDGTVHQFMNYNDWTEKKYLNVHPIKNKQPYFLSAFLIGAYQEILGDLHNLFGDTEAVHISIYGDDKYSIDHRLEGDNIYDVLKYVQYHRKELLEKIHKSTDAGIREGFLTQKEAGTLIKHFEKSLTSSTYHTEPE